MLSSGTIGHADGPSGRRVILFLLLAVLACCVPAVSFANPDVYRVLPPDTRILQYSLADFDGDARGELAVLYKTADETRLTLFKDDSGHWKRWWDDNGILDREEGDPPRSLEAVDVNGDGKAEMLTYYLAEGNTALAARILALESDDPADPAFEVLLEDVTSPPGYPLLGMEGEEFSVTFLKMASEEGDGYRRVYCWKGDAFEKCREVVWEKP